MNAPNNHISANTHMGKDNLGNSNMTIFPEKENGLVDTTRTKVIDLNTEMTELKELIDSRGMIGKGDVKAMNLGKTEQGAEIIERSTKNAVEIPEIIEKVTVIGEVRRETAGKG